MKVTHKNLKLDIQFYTLGTINTLCIIEDKRSKFHSFGIARLHPKDYDVYDPYLGRKVALTTALKNSIFGREVREKVWERFFKNEAG